MRLSILIPTYNDVCNLLVNQLHQQAEALLHDNFEIIVGDDGSTDPAVIAENNSLAALPHCHIHTLPENRGRSCIRNEIARRAKGEWLLYIDGDMALQRKDFIQSYMTHCTSGADIYYGGYDTAPATKGNLRSIYEHKHTVNSDAKKRMAHPFANFHSSNFMIRRDVMLKYPFDERITTYGYEDILLGKTLKEHGMTIKHINAQVRFERFETNTSFMQKTQEAIQNLMLLYSELQAYSPLLKAVNQLNRWHLTSVFILIDKWLGKTMERNLLSSHPSIHLFKLYKLAYAIRLYRNPSGRSPR